MFCDTQFESRKVKLASGDSLLLFTDGVTETVNADGAEYGNQRLCESMNGFASGGPSDLISHCLGHVTNFRGSAERHDDLSILALKLDGEAR